MDDKVVDKSAEKHKALKTYTRQLLREHEELARVADERAAEVERLQQEAAAYEAKAQKLEEAQRQYEEDEKRRKKKEEMDQEDVFVGSGQVHTLFGELCRTRERASAAEVAATRLQIQLAMQKELRTVDVARTRAAASRALAAALASLRRRATLSIGQSVDEDATQRIIRQRAEEAIAKDEREALVYRLEEASREVRIQFAQKPKALNNADGSARRYIQAIEACLQHRISASEKHEPRFLLNAAIINYASPQDAYKQRRKADAILLAVARAKQANIPRWMARAGWNINRAVLIELLNRGVLAIALRALCIEENNHVSKAAESAVLSYQNGALLLDSFATHRVLEALEAVESKDKIIFACHHLYERARSLDDFDRRTLHAKSRVEAITNFVACGPDDETESNRLFSLDDDFSTSEEIQQSPQHKEDDDDICGTNTALPGTSMLAALRRRGAKSVATTALDLAPWRRVAIEPARPWSREPRGFFQHRVRLKEGPVDHVVCYQWQSRSDKLRWSLVFYDSRRRRAPDINIATPPRRSTLNTAQMSTSPQSTFGIDSDDSLGAQAPDPSELTLELPEEDSDDDASAAPTNTANSAQQPLVFRSPEIWSPAELIPGAERNLGPVRESWCLVPKASRIALRCDLIAGRPLVRPRHARFRAVAVRAEDFFHTYMQHAACAFDAAAWLVAHNRGGLPPNDAADYCAKRQLQAWASAANATSTNTSQPSASSLFEPIAPRLSSIGGPMFLF